MYHAENFENVIENWRIINWKKNIDRLIVLI